MSQIANIKTLASPERSWIGLEMVKDFICFTIDLYHSAV